MHSYMVSSNYSHLITIIICLPQTQVFLSSIDNFQTDVFGLWHVLLHQVRVNLGVMAKNEYSILPTALEL